MTSEVTVLMSRSLEVNVVQTVPRNRTTVDDRAPYEGRGEVTA